MSYVQQMPDERDWKMFRKKLPQWQERFMNRMIKEYTEILNQRGKDSSDIFWELDARMRHDKKLSGVVVWDMRRSNMYEHLIELLWEDAITVEDLSEFSADLRERIGHFMRLQER